MNHEALTLKVSSNNGIPRVHDVDYEGSKIAGSEQSEINTAVRQKGLTRALNFLMQRGFVIGPTLNNAYYDFVVLWRTCP